MGTNVLGVGIDQIEVSRIRKSLDRHGDLFWQGVLLQEQEVCMKRTDPALASRPLCRQGGDRQGSWDRDWDRVRLA